MAVRFAASSLVALLALAGSSDAYWRMSCSVIQEGRIDPIVSPGKVANYAHKISGASNIGLSSTFETLQTANCTSCEIQADKSAYWTPILYYEHSNGSFEEVTAPGMAVSYLGRSETTSDIKPFPAGFRMLSGDPLARAYNTNAKTYQGTRPIADRVSFACLDTIPKAETPGMSDTTCVNGLRAQVHFQSCWNGVDLYKPDNSHVAYTSNIDNGECPPGYPVHFMHIFFEVLYSVANINQDGGRFVFSDGDPTGFGFYGDFLNGWDNSILTSAIASCGKSNGKPSGGVAACPAFTSDIQKYAQICPQQPPLVKEPVSGTIEKLPGCITITDDPQEATEADILCGAGAAQPGIYSSTNSTRNGTAETVIGSASPTGNVVHPTSSGNQSRTMSHRSIWPRSIRSGSGFATLASTSAVPLPSVNATTTAFSAESTLVASKTASIVNPVDGYASVGCYMAPLDGPVLTGSHYTDAESMTVQSCTAYCEKKGLPFAGLQDSQECYCGETNFGLKTSDSSCNLPCKGNAAEICGGRATFSIYQSG